MLSAAERQKIIINIWTARCMPVALAGVVGYATYVLVGPLCGMFVMELAG
jgi:palmitoyltransferase